MSTSSTTSLYDLANGLRAVTAAMSSHLEGECDPNHLAGLVAAAKHLAGDLEGRLWREVEMAEPAGTAEQGGER